MSLIWAPDRSRACPIATPLPTLEEEEIFKLRNQPPQSQYATLRTVELSNVYKGRAYLSLPFRFLQLGLKVSSQLET